MIEQAHQPEPLGHRNHLVRVRQQAAVGAAARASGIRRTPSLRLSISTTGSKASSDAPLVERGDDLVGRAHVVAAHARRAPRSAGRRRTSRGAWPWRCRARPARAPGFPRTVRAWRGAVTPPMVTVTATGPAAVCTISSRTPASSRSAAIVQFVGRAVVEDDAELVAGEAAEMILAAQLRADALGDLRDHLVGDVEAVGFVDAAEIVDRRPAGSRSEPRSAIASSSVAPSTSVRCARFISPVSASKRDELGERAARARGAR